MFKKLLAYGLICWASIGFSASPELVIKGNETPVPLGEVAVLKVSIKDLPAEATDVKFACNVIEVNKDSKITVVTRADITHTVDSNNKPLAKITFGSGLKNSYRYLTTTASYTMVEKDKEGKVVKTYTVSSDEPVLTEIKLGDDTPPPNPPGPGPGPGPNPNPDNVVLPDGKYKAAKLAYDLVVNGKFNNADRKLVIQEAKIRAAVAESAAAAIWAGAYDNVDANGGMTKLQAQFAKVSTDMGEAMASKNPSLSFSADYGQEMGTRANLNFKNGTFQSIRDYADFLREAATGLNAVNK